MVVPPCSVANSTALEGPPQHAPELLPRGSTRQRGCSTVVRSVFFPKIEHPNDAIVQVTLLLMLGDRVDVLESPVQAVLSGRPDNPITESGVLREFKNKAYRTRFGQHRVDLKHQPLDLLLWAAPYVAIGAGLYLGAKAIKKGA